MSLEDPAPGEPSRAPSAGADNDRTTAVAPDAGPRISVLVPVLNEIAHVETMLDGLGSQQLSVPVEFLLIDGGSTDGTREHLQRAAAADARFRLVENPAGRIPSALNVGLRSSTSQFVARMDAHTVYPSTYLESGMRRLAVGDADWVSGPALPFGEGRWSRRVALALETSLGVGGASFRRATSETETDTGFTGILRRETLERLGGWDEESLVNEDAELAARLRAGGGRILCIPEMAARYIPRDSLGALRTQYFRYGFYRARTSRLHPHGLRRSNLLAPGLIVTLVLAVAGPRPVRVLARAGVAAYLAAVIGSSGRLATRAGVRDAAALPSVYATMHLSWGAGFLAGCLRFGLPVAAVVRAISGGRGLRADASDAPSVQGPPS